MGPSDGPHPIFFGFFLLTAESAENVEKKPFSKSELRPIRLSLAGSGFILFFDI
jgi:hypothetical protein